MSFDNSKKALSELSDKELTVLIRQNDNDAFEEIAARYVGLAAYIATKYRAAGFETGDFVQEGLLSLLCACKSYDDSKDCSFKNYAAVCIENRFKTLLRKSKSKGSIPNESIVSIDDAQDINDFSSDPEQLVLDREYLSAVLKGLKTDLSAMEQKIFSLYINGFTYRQISHSLSIPVKSVDNAVQRAKKKLAKRADGLLQN